MQANRFIEKRAAGEVPVGHMIVEFGTRSIARIVEGTGVDFAIIDTEHSGHSPHQVADLIAWFKGTTVAPFVRIPQVEYHFVARTLDFGALGIMVPNVKTGAQAKAIVDAAKYAPLGDRGIMLGNANTDFKGVNPAEFLEESNQNTTIICQIESVEGMENLEAIATTPGVDVLWVGHFDLTQSMGIPGQFHHPQFLDHMARVVEVANAHNLAAGIQPGSLEQAQEWMEIGYNVISYSGDFSVYAAALSQAVQGVRDLAARGA
ncbi:MAG: aldolase/citrate lyase family protein [Litorilinea sp.]